MNTMGSSIFKVGQESCLQIVLISHCESAGPNTEALLLGDEATFSEEIHKLRIGLYVFAAAFDGDK